MKRGQQRLRGKQCRGALIENIKKGRRVRGGGSSKEGKRKKKRLLLERERA